MNNYSRLKATVLPAGFLLAYLRVHYDVNVDGVDIETLRQYLCTYVYSIYGFETWSGLQWSGWKCGVQRDVVTNGGCEGEKYRYSVPEL